MAPFTCSLTRSGSAWRPSSAASNRRRTPRGDLIERLVARLPLILPLLGLALLLQVALGERERAGLLWAGLPCVLVLVAYVRSGRGARKGRGSAFTDAS